MKKLTATYEQDSKRYHKFIIEKQRGSGIWWVRWCDQHGRLHREKVGPKGLAKDVYAKRKLEVNRVAKNPDPGAR